MKEFVNAVHLIYNHLADTVSRDLFSNRLAYGLTGNTENMRAFIRTAAIGQSFLEKLDGFIAEKRKICIFGAGIWGQSILNSYPDIEFDCFIDNNVEKCKKRTYLGVPLVQFDEWLQHQENTAVIIAAKFHYEEIYTQLREHHFPDDCILNAGEMIDKANKIQYFDLPQLNDHRTDYEVFVDVGAFDGQSSVMFAQWSGAYKKIIALEPEAANRKKCEATLSALGGKYEMLPFGAWDQAEQASFVADLNGASHIDGCRQADGGSQVMIQTAKLDDLIHDKVTFIKMDIEGAEKNALRGAERLIKTCKPKLAICVYHNREDIWEIPKLILSYVPQYRLYLRHYSPTRDETVLYCII